MSHIEIYLLAAPVVVTASNWVFTQCLIRH